MFLDLCLTGTLQRNKTDAGVGSLGLPIFFRVLKKAFDQTDQIGMAYAVTRYSAVPTWAHLPLHFISVVVFMITYHFYVLGQKVIVTLNFCEEGMGFAGSLKWIARSTIGCRPVPPRVFKKWDLWCSSTTLFSSAQSPSTL